MALIGMKLGFGWSDQMAMPVSEWLAFAKIADDVAKAERRS